MPTRQLGIGIAVAAKAAQRALAAQRVKTLPVGRTKGVRRRGVDAGLRQLLTPAGPHGLAIALRLLACQPRPALTQHRQIHEPQHGLALVQQGHQRAPQRRSSDEALGAVDGVDHPHVLGVQPLAAMLLAQDAVHGCLRLQHRAHRGLGLAVGNGDRALVRFGQHIQRGAEVPQRVHTGRIGQGVRQGQEGGNRGWQSVHGNVQGKRSGQWLGSEEGPSARHERVGIFSACVFSCKNNNLHKCNKTHKFGEQIPWPAVTPHCFLATHRSGEIHAHTLLPLCHPAPAARAGRLGLRADHRPGGHRHGLHRARRRRDQGIPGGGQKGLARCGCQSAAPVHRRPGRAHPGRSCQPAARRDLGLGADQHAGPAHHRTAGALHPQGQRQAGRQGQGRRRQMVHHHRLHGRVLREHRGTQGQEAAHTHVVEGPHQPRLQGRGGHAQPGVLGHRLPADCRADPVARQ
ncbi:hypothetical protein D3C71_1274980 [compost metagenome]